MALTVFVVDDSPLVVERLVALLGALEGARVLGHTGDAVEAVREILALRPQAVVLDLHLGERSGMEVLRAVRPEAPEVDFYLLTNFPSPAHRKAAEDLGARGFYDKTSEFQALLRLLGERARPASA